MKKLLRMSDSEEEVMEALWNCGGKTTSFALHQELSKTREWKLNTVITFLSRLAKKGLINADKAGRGKPSLYYPLVSRTEYKSYETQQFLKKVHNGSIKNLVTALYDGQALNTQDFHELKDWFDQLPDDN